MRKIESEEEAVSQQTKSQLDNVVCHTCFAQIDDTEKGTVHLNIAMVCQLCRIAKLNYL